jgi:hypothetical protein
MTALLHETARTPLDELEARLDGELLKPGDEGWDEARTAWNLAVDQRPAAVVLAESAPTSPGRCSPRRVPDCALPRRERGSRRRLARRPFGHYAGTLFFPLERARQVLGAWLEWTETVPEEVMSVGRIMRFPDFPEVPEPLRGNGFALVEAVYLGDEAEGAELTRPLRELGPVLDTTGVIPTRELSAPRSHRGTPAATTPTGGRRV